MGSILVTVGEGVKVELEVLEVSEMLEVVEVVEVVVELVLYMLAEGVGTGEVIVLGFDLWMGLLYRGWVDCGACSSGCGRECERGRGCGRGCGRR
jgi:hypothetical protein